MAYPPDLSYGEDTRVVLIGTTKCPNDAELLPPIPHAEQNILRLERLFTDPDIIGLPLKSIVRILDWDEPSAVVSAVYDSAGQANDTLIVYFAGHGVRGDLQAPLYLVTPKSTSKGKRFNAVSVTELKLAMAQSPARKRMLILDCCHAGLAFQGDMAERGDVALTDQAIDVEGTYGIAAVPGEFKAFAPPNETLTRFTGAFVDVLENGIDRDQQVLNIDEVYDEIAARINRKGDAPLPRKRNWEQAERFVLARNRSLRRPGTDRLFQAVEGLRQTMTATGARLAAIEAKASTIDDVVARLAKMEEGPTAGSSARGNPATEPWERLRVSREVWDSMPAHPYKLRVLRYFAGRRNAFAVFTMMVAVGPAIFLAMVNGDFAVKRAAVFLLAPILGLIGLLLAWSQGRPRLAMAAPGSHLLSDEAEAELRHNERLNEALDARVGSLFGHPMEAAWTWLAAVAGIGLGVLIVLLAYSTAPEMFQILEYRAEPWRPPPVTAAP